MKKCINTYEIKPLRVIFTKASAYVKSYHGETKWINFFIKDEDLLKKYNDPWNKVSNDIKEELVCEHIYNKKVSKTEIRSYGNKSTDLHTRKLPEAGSNQCADL